MVLAAVEVQEIGMKCPLRQSATLPGYWTRNVHFSNVLASRYLPAVWSFGSFFDGSALRAH